MEQRIHPRFLTLKTAQIVADGLAAPIDCAILNYSQSGAALLVPRFTAVPDAFRLLIDPDGAMFACRVRWRSGSRVGVSFHRPGEACAVPDEPGVTATKERAGHGR